MAISILAASRSHCCTLRRKTRTVINIHAHVYNSGSADLLISFMNPGDTAARGSPRPIA
eukprot:COSAG05_NODE_9_length_39734_cov_180.598067_7_plen_59_part_00